VGQNSIYSTSYIGDEQLPQGVNPFSPQPVTPTGSVSWIWILVLGLVCIILISGLIYACFKWRSSQAELEAKRGVLYSEDNEPLANNINKSEAV